MEPFSPDEPDSGPFAVRDLPPEPPGPREASEAAPSSGPAPAVPEPGQAWDLPARPWRQVSGTGAPSGRARVRPGPQTAPLPGARPRATCILLADGALAELEAAGRSALEQSVPFDEVLVAEVDPEGRAGELERVQHTLGVARGELVFFLRAADRFDPEHLERHLALYAAHPRCGSVDGAYRRFGRREELVRRRDGPGSPVLQAALAGTWDPARLALPALSALSLRRALLAQVLPFPAEVLEDWREDPCEPLLRAALSTGWARGYVSEAGVRVRVDDAAFDLRREGDREGPYRRRLALARLGRHLDERLGHRPELARLAAAEFCTLRGPSRTQLAAYLELALQADAGLADRLAMVASILVHHLRARRGQRRSRIRG